MKPLGHEDVGKPKIYMHIKTAKPEVKRRAQEAHVGPFIPHLKKVFFLNYS